MKSARDSGADFYFGINYHPPIPSFIRRLGGWILIFFIIVEKDK